MIQKLFLNKSRIKTKAKNVKLYTQSIIDKWKEGSLIQETYQMNRGRPIQETYDKWIDVD